MGQDFLSISQFCNPYIIFRKNTFIMQASIYRRNYYLISGSSGKKTASQQSKQRQVYSQTARVINEMISHIKSLLFKINSIREELESYDQSNDQISDVDDLIEHFREFHKGLPLTFFSQFPLDDKMLGPFVMRITKQMGYWRKLFPFLTTIISDIDEIFEEQKKNQTENISLIYFMTIKKITSECTQFFKSIKTKIIQSLKKESQQEKQVKQANILMVPYFQQSMNGEYLKSIREDMQQQMEVYIRKLYHGLQIISFAAIDDYATEISKENNVQIISKKQLTRNKKIKKQVKAYKISFKEYRKKKEQKKKQKLLVRNRLILKSQQKDSIQESLMIAPSLSKKSSKVTLPSIKSSQKQLEISYPKKNPLKSGNKSSNSSLPKKRKGASKIRLKAATTKLKL